VPRPDAAQPGLRFIATAWGAGAGAPTLTLINEEGTVLHEWSIDGTEIFPNVPENVKRAELHGSVLLPNGDVLFNLDYVGTARMNSCGKVEWTLTEKNHHAISRGTGETFWIPAVSQSPERNYPGLDNPWVDRILHVNAEGDILKDISLLRVLHENDLERYIAKMRATGLRDATHLNDVEPLEAKMANEYPLFDTGDLVASLKRLDLVLVFDPATLDVKWYTRGPFIGQHDPDFLGSGWIGLFDNNIDGTKDGAMLGGSRIVMVRPHTDSMRVPFPAPKSDLFYTKNAGEMAKTQKWEYAAH
jgi:hypothetical protein